MLSRFFRQLVRKQRTHFSTKIVPQDKKQARKCPFYRLLRAFENYSNSIVATGFGERSYITLFTPFTSAVILLTRVVKSSYGNSGTVALVASTELTARMITIQSSVLFPSLIPVDVHGGITFSSGGKASKYPVESDLYWFGFDCAHCNDRIDVDKLREYFPDGKFTESRIENALYFSDSEVRTLEYVTQECMNLADQIAEVEQLLKQS